MIGIVGVGIVGSAVYNSIKHEIINSECVELFDIKEGYKSLEEYPKHRLHDIRVLFICVPTPLINDIIDISYVDNILHYLIECKYQGIVVIKSTIQWHHLKHYDNNLDILYMPEFLNEKTAIEDMYNQTHIIIGGDKITAKKFISLDIFKLREEAQYHITSAKIASNFKYARNIKNALNVLYWNMIEDLFGDESEIAKLMEYLPTDELTNIYQDKFRGYGGSCLPKDVKTILSDSDNILLHAINNYNDKLAYNNFNNNNKILIH